MTAQALLCEMQTKGIVIKSHDNDLVIDAPKGLLTDDLRQAIRQRKAEILALLQTDTKTQERSGKIGCHGDPCPQCGDTWQWPTTDNTWICSWCFVQGRHVVREI